MQYCNKPAQNTIAAYILQYNRISEQHNDPAYVDIGFSPMADLLFTGELSGCSVIVTEHGSGYRVYHDARYCSSILYDHVVMAVDHCDYAMSYEDCTPRKIDVATACMHCVGKTWKLYAQLLNENEENADNVPPNEVPDSKRVLRYKESSNLIVREHGTGCTPQQLQHDRNQLYDYLRPIAVEYLGPDRVRDEVDGPFKSFNGDKGPTMDNPFISRTQTLRDDIRNGELRDMLRSRMTNHDFRAWEKKLDDSRSTDVTLLWWKLKQEKGTRHVVCSA